MDAILSPLAPGSLSKHPTHFPRFNSRCVTSIGIAIDKSATLDAVDNDGGVAEVVSMLDSLRERLENDSA